MKKKFKAYGEQLDEMYEMTYKMPWGAEVTHTAIDVARALLNICLKQDEMIEAMCEQMETERRLP